MITAIDTNILLDILVPNPRFLEASEQALDDAASAGSLVICDVVYAELCVHFPKHRDCDEFLSAADIRVEALRRETLFEASRAWRRYRQQGGPRTRILPDFLIGAHAQEQTSRLLSRDGRFYGKYFAALEIVNPAEAG